MFVIAEVESPNSKHHSQSNSSRKLIRGIYTLLDIQCTNTVYSQTGAPHLYIHPAWR